MPRTKAAPGQLSLLDAKSKTAPCVPAIRFAVNAWREGGYKGITGTTRILLNYWFKADHRLPNGRSFSYHYAQREAMETLVYLYEVAKVRRQKDLLETYVSGLRPDPLKYDDFARYCVKMATGSGKTKVMSLAIAWQFFNATLESGEDYAKNFLILAPNVIVFERLRTDFADGRIFRNDPVIPPELSLFWDFDCYVRGEGERAATEGALYLTNVQQLYERDGGADGDDADPMAAVMGPKPPIKKIEVEDFGDRLTDRAGHCMVINDEAHHTHDEESEWNGVIRRLHKSIDPCTVMQLDMTATPRHSKGALFSWTIYDFPLKQAIIENIVKRPMKGLALGIAEAHSDTASVKYEAYLTAGVERWKEYQEQLAPLGKKPLLFVMMNSTAEADEVAHALRVKYPEHFAGDKLHVIHTDQSGEIRNAKALEEARKVAREVDEATSPVNAIVSVLMLREGWDVQNVTVIVGLRPYSSKANILPEQTIGRGLRLMFRDQGSTYVERVDVIGNKKFIEFVEQLEREEDLQLDTFKVGQDKVHIVTIAPDPAKMDKDIALPVLSPILARKKTLAEEIASLDVPTLATPLPIKESDSVAKSFRYEGYDIITLEKQIERDYTIPEPQTSEEVISYYAKRIAEDVKLPSQFAALVPKVREFLEQKAFGQAVTLDSKMMIKAISSKPARFVTVDVFAKALRKLVIEERQPQLEHEGRKLSETTPFPYSRPTLPNASKSVFNLVPCDNEFERKFAKFLQDADDVTAFSKLPSQFGFLIEYTDNAANLRYYEPDFVAVLEDGTHWIIETKGQENVDVAHKNRAATLWCENASNLTETKWEYTIIHQKDYEQLQPDTFSDLFALQLPL